MRRWNLAALLVAAALVAGVPAAAAESAPVVAAACAEHGRNNGPVGPKTGSVNDRIERVVAAATAMTGRSLSYSWGAGGKGGPSCGISDPSPGGHVDYNVYGFDCSGLTLYAFWKGAGIDVGATSRDQYKRGTKIARADMRRGDLIFWKTSSETIVHVALYLGGGKIAESSVPRGAKSVHVTDLTTRKGDAVITDHAARFIA